MDTETKLISTEFTPRLILIKNYIFHTIHFYSNVGKISFDSLKAVRPYKVGQISEVYLEPCQTFEMEVLRKKS